MKKTIKAEHPQAGGPAELKSEDLGIQLTQTRPNLYMGIVGTLVLQEGASFRIAPFAREFIREINGRFRFILLSKLSSIAAREVADLLEAEFEIGVWRKGLGKVSGIDFSRPFLWIDHAPTSRDLMRLAEERCSSQLITVNGRDGVTRGTLNKVEACLEELMVRD